jgi:hypothetical protein
MSNRRFEMYQYRQVVYRMRLGESDRTIAKAGLMGRRKAGELREIAQSGAESPQVVSHDHLQSCWTSTPLSISSGI